MTPNRSAGTAAPAIGLAALANALPDLGLALVFLGMWVTPHVFGDEMVRWLFLLILMEFISIQSAGLMGGLAIANVHRAVRSSAILGLGALYTVFAGGISIAMASWWPVVGFWCQTLNRLLGVIVGRVPDEDLRAYVAQGWGASVTFYIATFFLVLLLPIPPFGLMPSYVAVHEITGGAWWSGQPQKLMAFGVCYYGLTACSELAPDRWPMRILSLGLPRRMGAA